jgi:hypothetical protein
VALLIEGLDGATESGRAQERSDDLGAGWTPWDLHVGVTLANY